MRKTLLCFFVAGFFCLQVTASDPYHFRGKTATAEFNSWNEDAHTNVFMVASERRDQYPPGAGTAGMGLYLRVEHYNWSSGFTFWGETDKALAPEQFRIDRKLNSAHLVTDVEVWNWYGGLYTFKIDMNVTATGDTVKDDRREHPGGGVTYHWTGVSREASAEGSLLAFWDGPENPAENLTPDPSVYGQLMNVRSMQLVAGGDVYHFRSKTAEARFEYQTGGIRRTFWIVVSESREQYPPQKGTSFGACAFVLAEHDLDGNLLTWEEGGKDLAPGEFRIDQRLSTARLNTEVEVWSWAVWEYVTFKIDMTLNAVAPALRDKRHEHPEPGVDYRWTGVSREAEAVATVALFWRGELWGEANLTPESSVYARLMNVRSMQLTLGGDLYHFRGYTATAWFERFSDFGGEMWIYIVVSEDREQSPPGMTVTPNLYFRIYSSFEGLWLNARGMKRLLPGEFRIDRNLKSARITTEVRVTDPYDSSSTIPVAIDIAFSATGPKEKGSGYAWQEGIGFTWTGVTRSADAAGTVVVWSENLTPDPAVDAKLMKLDSMEVDSE